MRSVPYQGTDRRQLALPQSFCPKYSLPMKNAANVPINLVRGALCQLAQPLWTPVTQEETMSLQFDATPDELAVFLEEADEQLQLLDQHVLALEGQGPSPILLQEVFRAAHTLKGSSSAIGHQKMASLTHSLESVFDCLRRGRLELDTRVIDLLLESLDALRVLKEEVVSLEDSGLDPSSLVAALSQFIDENRSQPNGSPLAEETRAIAAETGPEPQAGLQNGRCYRIVVSIDSECAFPAARFYQVHMALSTIGTIVESVPTRAEIEAERVGTELRLTLITPDSRKQIRDLTLTVPEIASVAVESAEEVTNGEVAAGDNDFSPTTRRVPQSAERASQDVPSKETGNSLREIRPEREAISGTAKQKTVRIDVERLDALMNLVGELVIDSTRLAQLSSSLRSRYEGEESIQDVSEISLHLQRITDELQDRVMKARMFPVSSVFSRFPRMVRDLAQRSGKKVKFVIEGEETELDRSVIEEISDPLIHLLRNAVDHGIETPEERIACGKAEVGCVLLTASHRENHIVLTVEDDGKGIDPDDIRHIAVEKGLLSAETAGRMSDREALDIIFMPGFSTARQVSDISGRGVGMDIVRTNIQKLNGQVSVESSVGQGSRFVLELPLTLAIMDALLVGLDESIFAIPLASVTETLRVRLADMSSVNRERVIQLRGRVLPLLPMGRVLGIGHKRRISEKAYVVVAVAGKHEVGIIVDSLIGQQRVVIKSLDKHVGNAQGISGATILGDGQVALILDVPALVKTIIQENRGA